MVEQTHDPELIQKLRGGAKRIDLTDETGAVIGHYLPHSEYVRLGGVERARLREEAIAEMKRGECVTAEEVLHRLDRIKKFVKSQR